MSKDEIISKLNDINADLVTEIDRLKQERDEARQIARLAVTTWHWHQETGYPPTMGYDEQTIQALYRGHPWLKEEPGDHEKPPGQE